MGKKHADLYNRVFEALHHDDRFVFASDMNGDELATYLGGALDTWLDEHVGATGRQIADFVIFALVAAE